MQQPISFALSLIDPTTQRPVEVRFAGAIDSSGDLNLAIAAVQGAVQRVLGGRLQRGELAMPTIAPSLPYVLPEISQEANAQLAAYGSQVMIARLDASVPQSAVAPAAAAIAAAPSPLQSAAQNFTNNATHHVASHVPTGVNVHVGGWKIGLNQNGLNTKGLADQVKEKAFDKLFGCAIVGGVIAVLGIITAVVIAKIVLFG